MAYNLPPPWNPGFALPDNVDDEGLERRAFITKMLPRGSYDPSTDGTGGFAVPQYVLDEGTGQGTYTTKWAPSGSYAGPKVPHWLNRRPQVVKQVSLPGGGKVSTVQPQAMSGDDTPMPAAMENYGVQAAQVIISSVAGVPANKRAAAMKTAMNKLDASLWTRTQAIFSRYVSQGMAPAQAFPAALARAMSTGMTAELIKKGFRSSPAPQVRPSQGLGCYTCMAALGAAAEGGVGSRDSEHSRKPLPKQLTPDQQAAADAAAAKQTRDALAYNLAHGGSVDANGIPHGVPQSGGLLDDITNAISGGISAVGGAVTGGISTAGSAVGAAAKATGGAVASAGSMVGKAVVDAGGTVVNWTVDAAGAVYDGGGKLIGWVKDAAGAIYDAAGKLIGWIVDAAEALGDLACDALNVPAVGTAVGAVATAVGGVYGGPAGAAAGQVGTQLARKGCAVAPPPPPPVAPAPLLSQTSKTLLLAGGAVLAVLLILPPPKKKPSQAASALKPATVPK